MPFWKVCTVLMAIEHRFHESDIRLRARYLICCKEKSIHIKNSYTKKPENICKWFISTI
jgi:hypothetical protein